jgi:hypothetical protein
MVTDKRTYGYVSLLFPALYAPPTLEQENVARLLDNVTSNEVLTGALRNEGVLVATRVKANRESVVGRGKSAPIAPRDAIRRSRVRLGRRCRYVPLGEISFCGLSLRRTTETAPLLLAAADHARGDRVQGRVQRAWHHASQLSRGFSCEPRGFEP